MSLALGLFDLFSHDYIGVMGFGENYHIRGIITLPQGFLISAWLLTGSVNIHHLFKVVVCQVSPL